MEITNVPFEPEQIMPNPNGTVSCVAVYDKDLIVGTSNVGGLLIYDLSHPNSPKSTLFHKRQIKQLEAVPKINGFICRIDGKIIFVQLPSQKETIVAENAYLFSVFSSDKATILCVASNKSAYLYGFSDGLFFQIKEVPLPESAWSMANQRNQIILGGKKSYASISWDYNMLTNNFLEISSEKKITKNATIPTEQGEMQAILLQISNSITVITNEHKEKTDALFRIEIKWENAPKQIAFRYPFVYAMHGNSIEIQSIVKYEAIPLITLKIPGTKLLGISEDGQYVFSSTSIWKLKQNISVTPFSSFFRPCHVIQPRNPNEPPHPDDPVSTILAFMQNVEPYLANIGVFTIRQFSQLPLAEIDSIDKNLRQAHERAREIVDGQTGSLSDGISTPVYGYIFVTVAEKIDIETSQELKSTYLTFQDFVSKEPHERENHLWKAIRQYHINKGTDSATRDIDIFSHISWNAACSFGRFDCTASSRAIYFFWHPLNESLGTWHRLLSEFRTAEGQELSHVLSINLTSVCKNNNGKIYSTISQKHGRYWRGSEFVPISLTEARTIKSNFSAQDLATALENWMPEACIVTPSGTITAECISVAYTSPKYGKVTE